MKKHTGKGKPILEPKLEKKTKKKKQKKKEGEESSESSSSSSVDLFAINHEDEKKEEEEKRKYDRPWDTKGAPKPSKDLKLYEPWHHNPDMPAYPVERVNLFKLHGIDNWYSALQPPKMKFIKQLDRLKEKHRVLFFVDTYEEKKKKKKNQIGTYISVG